MELQNWISEARDHWKQFQPRRYRELQQSGQLAVALRSAAEMTHREMSELEAVGFANHEAWEMVRERYLFPPEEPTSEKLEPNAMADLYREKVQFENSLLKDE